MNERTTIVDGGDLKKLWLAGSPSFGTWITLADPAVCAIMANVGFDWVMIDAEHMPFNPDTLRDMLMILRARGVVPLVRIRVNDEALVKQTLDWGAEGIVFPLIRTADDARRAVASCRYPPAGVRGFNPREASNFFQDLAAYMARANDGMIVVLQIEHVDAVNNIDEILRVPGVDALMIGPADLSFTLGVPLQTDAPSVREAIEVTLDKAKAAHIPIGIAAGDTVTEWTEYVSRGFTFLPVSGDFVFMAKAAAEVLKQMCDACRPFSAAGGGNRG